MVLVKKEAPMVDSCVRERGARASGREGLREGRLGRSASVGVVYFGLINDWVTYLVLVVVPADVTLHQTCFSRSHFAQQHELGLLELLNHHSSSS